MSGQDDLIFLYLGRLAFASVATLSQFHYCDYLETEVLHTSGNGLWWTTRTEVCSFFFSGAVGESQAIRAPCNALFWLVFGLTSFIGNIRKHNIALTTHKCLFFPREMIHVIHSFRHTI